MTVYLVVHTSQVHCSGVTQWWACISLTSAPLLAETGCETCQRIVLQLGLYCVTVHGNKGSLQVSGIIGAFCDMWLLNTDILAGNA